MTIYKVGTSTVVLCAGLMAALGVGCDSNPPNATVVVTRPAVTPPVASPPPPLTPAPMPVSPTKTVADGSTGNELRAEIRDELKDAKNEIRDFFTVGQGSWQEKWNEYIESVDEQLEKVSERLNYMSEEARAKHQERVANLDAQYNSIKADFKRLENALSEEWKQNEAAIQTKVEKYNNDLKEFWDDVRDNKPRQ